MTIDVDKLNFYGGHPIDKIVQDETTVSIVNNGATNNTPQRAKIVTDTDTNTYGKACYVRAKWSIDGTNFNSITSHLIYEFTITTEPPLPAASTDLWGLKAGCSVGVDSSTVYFVTANGFHGDVTYDGTTYTYTPTSLTFTIKYILFEI